MASGNTTPPSTSAAVATPHWAQLSPEASGRCDAKRLRSSSSDKSQQQQQQVPASQATAAQWQAASHLPARRVMVQRILQLTQQREWGGNASPQHAALLAKRIELSLYSRAASLTEYSNMATLRRRLQSLVATSVHEAAASRLLEVQAADHLTGKRRVLSRSLLSASEAVKRRRTTCRASGCSIFPSIGDDCVRTIISFLDGKEVMHQRLLNRFAAEFLPSCVLSLTVEAAQLARGLESPSSSMRQMTNLQGLIIHKAGTLSLAPTAVATGSTSTPLYAWGCAELPASQANDGEDAVLALAQALDSGSFRNLKKLQLVSVFVNTRSRNALRALCQALIDGGCPLLEDLLLAGNSLADFGALEVARLLTVASAPRLVRLDLRRNFIGETGLHAVLAAFAQTQKLQTQQTSRQLEVLCMGGNLVTDNCVAALQTLLAGSVCPQLRFLGLEDNFLSVEGVQLVLEAAAVCTDSSPRVRRVSCDRGVAGEAADA